MTIYVTIKLCKIEEIDGIWHEYTLSLKKSFIYNSSIIIKATAIYFIKNIAVNLLCLSNIYFLQIAIFSEKSSEGRLSSEYCHVSHNNSTRELMAGRRAHFFTSIPYTSDRLSSTCRVTLHGGFHRQAACVTQRKMLYTFLPFYLFHRFLPVIKFITGKLFITY